MNKEQLFRKIVECHRKVDAYVDNIPLDIRSAFFDNEIVNQYAMLNEKLIQEVFVEWAESVNWFIYEWKPGYGVAPNSGDELTVINNLDEYITYLQLNEGFPRD